jgi:hypothetical protein
MFNAHHECVRFTEIILTAAVAFLDRIVSIGEKGTVPQDEQLLGQTWTTFVILKSRLIFAYFIVF